VGYQNIIQCGEIAGEFQNIVGSDVEGIGYLSGTGIQPILPMYKTSMASSQTNYAYREIRWLISSTLSEIYTANCAPFVAVRVMSEPHFLYLKKALYVQMIYCVGRKTGE